MTPPCSGYRHAAAQQVATGTVGMDGFAAEGGIAVQRHACQQVGAVGQGGELGGLPVGPVGQPGSPGRPGLGCGWGGRPCQVVGVPGGMHGQRAQLGGLEEGGVSGLAASCRASRSMPWITVSSRCCA